ncbi:P-loop NTPase family protein [Flavobacterium hercynium]|uniref:Adenylate kinase n=1 Tax=Flavobacterium hercynium TaxID=387094 RepID=A0A226GMP5_9FLAO|nr:adenylate kinase [Flavobacterium hercynium]OXA83185.1 adenylate kinase [Flavobacterium hercynium]SMP37261.1 Adenylate kinase [Flavobacterium hercynium]
MKIHIFGASGSGVTTTGEALAAQLKLDYFDSDAFFWKQTAIPFSERCNPEERNTSIRTALDNSKKWILGGSVFQWGDAVFPDFDLVVYLWIPQEIRMERLKKRELERYGTIIYTDPNRNEQFENFMTWASDYDQNTGIASRNREAHEQWMTSIPFPLLKIEGDFTLEERIALILQKVTTIELT